MTNAHLHSLPALHRLHKSELAKGKNRERHQTEAWFFAYIESVLSGIGLPEGWWCAFNIPRRSIPGLGSSGDIDVLAGPVSLAISDREFGLMLDDARRERPGCQHNYYKNVAYRRAGREGLIEWPPLIGFTAAIEVKSSFFDGERWKATHEGEKDKILGALDERRGLGINVTAFMHLGVVRSAPTAQDLDKRMNLARSTFPYLEPTSLGPHGYYSGFMGAVVTGSDQMAQGAMEGRHWWKMPEPSLVKPQPWHDAVRERLGSIPPPRFVRTCMHACPACGAWRTSESAELVDCSCASADAPTCSVAPA